MQVDPIKPTLNPLRSKRLKLEHEKLLSNSASNFHLRHYIMAFFRIGWPMMVGRGRRITSSLSVTLCPTIYGTQAPVS